MTTTSAACFLVMFLPLFPAQEEPPYNPSIAPASDEALLAIPGIHVPQGLEADLFAAEPLLAHPVAFWFDERGRLFVAESFRVNDGVTDTRKHMVWLDDDLASRTVEDRVAMYKKFLPDSPRTYTAHHERIRLLTDADGDGRADRSSVFADGFHDMADGIAAGGLARQGNIWFACIPHLWLLRDEDGDGKADSRKSLHYGYGVHVGFYGHDLHGLCFGPDGRLYFSIGDRGLNIETEGRRLFNPDTGAVLRCEPDGSKLEILHTGLRNPQELAFDDSGDLFTGDNNSDGGDQARWVQIVEGGDSGWRIGYQFITEPVSRGPWNAEKLWLPRWEGQPAYIVPPIANIGDGPSGIALYPGTGLPPRFEGRFLLCDFRGVNAQSGVRSFSLRRQGATYSLVDPEKLIWSILATDVDFGPDGAIYISDWVEGWEKTGKGRIYRVFDPKLDGAAEVLEVRKLLAAGMRSRPIDELIRLLGHKNRRVRQEAHFELAARGRDSTAALFAAARTAGPRMARLHALWALGILNRRAGLPLEPLLLLLADPDAEVRAQAAKAAGDSGSPAALEPLLAALQDAEPRVRFFAALGVGKMRRRETVPRILDLLAANADADAYIRHACVQALAWIGSEDDLKAAAGQTSAPVRLGALLALRRMESAAVAVFLKDREPRLAEEAGRAIYDVPIGSAMAQLAELPIRPETDPMLARRILNANAALGTAAAAERLAGVAAAAASSIPQRIESLDLLADWSKAAGRDRITGAWRRFPARAAEDALNALRPAIGGILQDAPEKARLAALRTAARMMIQDAVPRAFELVRDRRLSGSLRAAALKTIEAIAADRIPELTRAALDDGDPALRIEGRRLLAALKPREAIPVLERALEEGSVVERQGAFQSLSRIEDPGAAAVLSRWLDRLIAGTVAPEVQLDLLEAARLRPAADLAEKLNRYEASKPEDDLSIRYREALLGGSAELGRKVFFEKAEVSCQRCHKAQGSGGEVGPPLDGIGKKQARAYLLDAIVQPARQIAQGFESVLVITRTGLVVTGVLREEDETRLVLSTAEGKTMTILKSSIRRRAKAGSAMPDDLMKFLTPIELRDLVEFLAGL